MESGFGSDSKECLPLFHGLEDVEEEEEGKTGDFSSTLMLLPCVPENPQTPREPLEFLSRSWSVSASEISKALAQKQKTSFQPQGTELNLLSVPETTLPSADPPKKTMSNPVSSRKSGPIAKWFNYRDSYSTTTIKKDRARAQNARVHSAVSVAALASALASVTASMASESQMAVALASAAELLASHSIEAAEAAGADHDRLVSAVRSAVDVCSPSDIVTLTAAAATALRGEAALRARLPKEARKNSAIIPCEKVLSESPSAETSSHYDSEDQSSSSFDGDLLQRSENGVLKSRRVSVHVNKKSEVMIKMKSHHVGRAFSRNDKCVVYEVCEDASAWPYRKETETSEDHSFGLKTAKGLIEFKCKNSVQKHRWVSRIKKLLIQAKRDQNLDQSSTESSSVKDSNGVCD